MQPPLISPPELPKTFHEDYEEGAEEWQVDRFLIARCDLFELFHEILNYNHGMRNELGGEEDVKERLRLYEKLLTWRATLINGTRVEQQELARFLFLKYVHPPPV